MAIVYVVLGASGATLVNESLGFILWLTLIFSVNNVLSESSIVLACPLKLLFSSQYTNVYVYIFN